MTLKDVAEKLHALDLRSDLGYDELCDEIRHVALEIDEQLSAAGGATASQPPATQEKTK